MNQFALRDGVLCCNVTVHDAHVTQLVIPESLIPVVLQLIHNAPQSGHPGHDKSLTMARQCYYWPKMCIDVISHVAQCLSCVQTKFCTTTAPILEYPTPDGPFDTVAIDLLKLPHSHQGSTYVLVCVNIAVALTCWLLFLTSLLLLLPMRLSPLSCVPTQRLLFC